MSMCGIQPLNIFASLHALVLCEQLDTAQCRASALEGSSMPRIKYNKISLTQGKIALVSPCDYHRIVDSGPWHFVDGYARSTKHGRMHRFILECPDNMLTDHVHHDTIDNRRENIRICTPQQNNMNMRGKRNSSSVFKGVSIVHSTNKWTAAIKVDGSVRRLGSFDDERNAAFVYDIYARRFYGEFAYLNFPDVSFEDNPMKDHKVLTQQQAQRKAKPKESSTSRFKGVHFCTPSAKWRSKIGMDGSEKHLGYFHCEIQAAKAYDDAAKKYFGEGCYLNFPEAIIA